MKRGDFYGQACIEKLTKISNAVKSNGFSVYTYSARKDLDFNAAGFVVRGSSNDAGRNERTISRKKEIIDVNSYE